MTRPTLHCHSQRFLLGARAWGRFQANLVSFPPTFHPKFRQSGRKIHTTRPIPHSAFPLAKPLGPQPGKALFFTGVSVQFPEHTGKPSLALARHNSLVCKHIGGFHSPFLFAFARAPLWGDLFTEHPTTKRQERTWGCNTPPHSLLYKNPAQIFTGPSKGTQLGGDPGTRKIGLRETFPLRY